MELIKPPEKRIALGTLAPFGAEDVNWGNGFRRLNPFKNPEWMGHGHRRKRPVHFSKADTFENALLLLIFNNTNIANLGDATGVRGSTTAGSLYLSLHTADPGEAGTQPTNEATFTSYARKAIARASGAGGFTITTNTVALTDALTSFVACTGGSNTITHLGIGLASSGAGNLLYICPVGPSANQGEFTALASNDTATVPAISGVAVNDAVSVYPTPASTLPAGLTAGTIYFVKTISGTQVTFSATAGGATIDITADGSGVLFRHTIMTVNNGVTPQITNATLVTED